jgi:hypothetical protein
MSSTPKRLYQRHQLSALVKARPGLEALDGRTVVARELAAFRDALTSDLGGDPSTAQRALIKLIVADVLLLSRVDAYLLTCPDVINKKRRSVYPIVQQRASLADALTRRLHTLGLKRHAADASDLSAYLAAKAQAADDAELDS